eukprot:PhM_4_TR8051/c0_g1_i1/m.53609
MYSTSANDDRVRAMMSLYRDEKARETRTKQVLARVQQSSNDVLAAKMKLVEKLLDVQVKDEMNHLRTSTNVSLSDVNIEQIREKAREKVKREVTAEVDKSREAFSEDFMCHLEAMVGQSDAAAVAEVTEKVDEFSAPMMEKARAARAKSSQSGGGDASLKAVEEHARAVAAAGRREVEDAAKLKAQKETHARVDRSHKAIASLKKDFGDLLPLLQVRPIEYKTEIGVREAEINDLRKIIFEQRAEEERLVHERQMQMTAINSHREEILKEIEENSTKLSEMQTEFEDKQRDLHDIADAQQPYTGRWAVDTQQLERDLTYLCEEEFRLKGEYEERRRLADRSANEKTLLDDEVNRAIQGLNTLQEQYQSVIAKLEEHLNSAKERIFAIRSKVSETTSALNENRRRTVYRREDTRQQKRDLRAAINATISQMAIEEKLQQVLVARAMQSQSDAEKIKAESDYQSAVLNTQLYQLKAELKTKSDHIAALAEQTTDLRNKSEEGRMGDIRATSGQLSNRVDQLASEWALVEWDAATILAQTASKIDLNTRENDSMLAQLGQFVVVSEDLASMGLDAESSPTQTLEQVHAKMYNELSMRSNREAKLNQAIRLLQERHNAAQRGEHVPPLTRNRRIPAQQRKERREARERSRMAHQIAEEATDPSKRKEGATTSSPIAARGASQQHTTTSTPSGALFPPSPYKQASPSVPATPAQLTFPTPGASANRGASAADATPKESLVANTALAQEHRMRVIAFIKKEIQPLYDANQITKKRFVDIVERVSTEFLHQHAPSSALSDSDKRELVMKIQEVITWQDEIKTAKSGGSFGSWH